MLTLLAQAAKFGENPFITGEGYVTDLAVSDPCANIEKIISNTIGFITVLAGVLLIAYFIWGAVDWITSGGDSGKVGNARNKMTQAVIGVILVVLSYGLIGLIGTVTGLNVLDVCTQVNKITPNATDNSSIPSAVKKCPYATESQCRDGEGVESCTKGSDGCYAPNPTRPKTACETMGGRCSLSNCKDGEQEVVSIETGCGSQHCCVAN